MPSERSVRVDSAGLVFHHVYWILGQLGSPLGLMTLRKSYASPWNPWTLVEAMDKKRGRRFEKP